MDSMIQHVFRFVMYAMAGMVLEAINAVHGIDISLGYRVKRRVPRRYLEGFVSLYMIPLHGFGMLYGFEAVRDLTAHWNIGFRYLLWCGSFTFLEVAWGWFLDKTVGFYPWDYYAKSKYRMFRRGYTLWTLVPQWGVAGLILEFYSDLMRHISPHVTAFISAL